VIPAERGVVVIGSVKLTVPAVPTVEPSSLTTIPEPDATISSGNILLRATPETGVSGSTTYKIKREVM